MSRVDLESGVSVEALARVVVVTSPGPDEPMMGPTILALPASDALLLGAALVDAAMEVAGLGSSSCRAFIDSQMKRAADALASAPVQAPPGMSERAHRARSVCASCGKATGPWNVCTRCGASLGGW